MEGLAVFALAIAVIAVMISSWQGLMAEEQLRLSRLTEAETRKTLEQIRREMVETRRISSDLADKINDRITKALDNKATAESLDQALSDLLERDSVAPPSSGAFSPSPFRPATR
jgi:Flp pilus assembly protein TadB